MVIEPKHDFEENADVCIIGSGAGGAMMAKELSESGPLKIVMLEKGDYFKGEDFDQRAEIRSHIYQDGGVRFSTPVSMKSFPNMDIPVAILQGKCIGGTTTINEAVCYRTPELILERWREEYKVNNLTRNELEPHFENVEKFINVHRLKEDQLSANSLTLKKGTENLNYLGERSRQNRKNCESCGFCQLGCRYNRKQSMLVTAIPAAVRNGVRVYSNCNAERIKIVGRKAITVNGNVLKKLNGSIIKGKFKVNAKLVIVAGGTINSSQLLLKSGIDVNGRVGKNISMQPGVNFFAECEDHINCYKGIPIGYGCEEFSTHNGNSEYGWIMEDLGYHPSAFAALIPFTGEAHKEVMSNYPKYSSSTTILQDGPNGTMTIDKDGNPVIRYSLSESDKKKLKHAIKESCRIYFAAGAKKVITPYLYEGSVLTSSDQLDSLDKIKISAKTIILSSTHTQGGNCMGETPSAVVDSNCQVHGINNIFVSDGSVHPTSLGVNPQLTIMAISTKTADYIKQNKNILF